MYLHSVLMYIIIDIRQLLDHHNHVYSMSILHHASKKIMNTEWYQTSTPTFQ